ncbi:MULTISPECIES: arylsulfatase [unclassified Paenibacillus]|uniref:arylsulfatase n=1 Tax=unclassified Paenibacillus TaxID=185978 RepID=UPI000954B5A1|nr:MULTISPECIES: arylsulfatase [unclassified Paenibacillus]ASS67526.1 arylsulfatase [Paenibacillus sp. RUD330]SIQ73876.1 arylsulfatase [Paenibacillus sp. RU4X]SIQ95319.1 arylsulfatase [Paenibacillus sp. RU4T]
MPEQTTKPNVVLILNDDMGYSDLGCFGGEIDTPHLDRLAAGGIRLTQFYNTARCCPSRASLLTGLHPHQSGVGLMLENLNEDAYAGSLNDRCVTIAEVLKESGYRTYMSGKWHLSASKSAPAPSWPAQRGFDEFYGTIAGACSYFQPTTLCRNNDNIEDEVAGDAGYYYTDAISEQAVRFLDRHHAEAPEQPFFLYAAYTAPHWPLHAPEATIRKYEGRFDAGWDRLRSERLERMKALGIVREDLQLSPRDEEAPAWDEASEREWELRAMEVYAAQIDRMDQGIGTIVDALERSGRLDNTLLIFLADNGGCAEQLGLDSERWLLDSLIAASHDREGGRVVFGNDKRLLPGGESTYQSYGLPWANLSNTPFRLYKHWIHEGGISTPLILHWPERVADPGGLRHSPGQLTDIMATIAEAAGAAYPDLYRGRSIPPMEGVSLLRLLDGEADRNAPMFWEHEGNAAVRIGSWKLVRRHPGPWELYDLASDRAELRDLSAAYPERAAQMAARYESWADRCGVKPREEILRLLKR